MRDQEFFAKNRDRRYRVRCAEHGECPGADSEQAVLVAKVAPGAFLRHPLPNDLSDYQDDDVALAHIAGAEPYAADRKAKSWLSLEDTRQRFEKRLKMRLTI